MRREKRFRLAIALIVIVMMVSVTALALSVTALAQPPLPPIGNGINETPIITPPPLLTPSPNVTATPTATPSPALSPTPTPGFEAVTLVAAMITIAMFVLRKRRRFRGDEK